MVLFFPLDVSAASIRLTGFPLVSTVFVVLENMKNLWIPFKRFIRLNSKEKNKKAVKRRLNRDDHDLALR